MNVKVYHSIGQRFSTEDFKPSDFPSKFEWVANLNLEGNYDSVLEQAFHYTNHIHGDWTDNEPVISCKKTQNLDNLNRPRWISPRSTSVGDVVEVEGVFFLCESFGWKQFLPVAEKQMWICPECDETVKASYEGIAYNGIPWCGNCDCEMEQV